MRIRHFVTGLFRSHAFWMKEEDYGKALDNFVVACVDCILVNEKGEMLLGKRTIEPQPDWFIVGGRMKPGETFTEAAARNVKRELGLDIIETRFMSLPGVYSFVWARRQQEPKDYGSHTVSVVMVLHVINEEAVVIKPNEEYEKVEWFKPKDAKSNQAFHPGVRTYAEDLIDFLLNNDFYGN